MWNAGVEERWKEAEEGWRSRRRTVLEGEGRRVSSTTPTAHDRLRGKGIDWGGGGGGGEG